ncbi:ADP-ribosyl-[dinitrogen reductase] hydrolase [Alteromonadaceae bacterium Bs31]|nr:ADP-ribosyl-[dinitrogen reductase] hydrolase [Alteromonadaceae bacterium Bs31]
MIDRKQRYQGCLLGLAAGDAVGTTLEFRERDSFEPISDMLGGGPFKLEPGQWTDDTSMALCLASSLIQNEGFDAEDQIQRYCNWRDHGYMSSNGRCFDIGVTVSEALNTYQSTGAAFSGPTSPFSAGNGSLMRLAPVAMYYSPNLEQLLFYAGESSRTTHGAKECIDACRYFSTLLHSAFSGSNKDDIINCDLYQAETKKVVAIQSASYRNKDREAITGDGYVINCLEAALWCFAKTHNFRDAVLSAANLGDDADTTAAVCGQIAGAYYGIDGIPGEWKEKLFMRQDMEAFAEQLLTSN